VNDAGRLGGLLLRFWAGTATGIAVGWLAFRDLLFDPRLAYSQVVTIGLLLAALLSLRRAGSPVVAFSVASLFVAWQLWQAPSLGASRIVGHVAFTAVLAVGALACAALYEALLARGFRIGKFLILGPVLAGAYFAATPLLSLGEAGTAGVYRDLLANVFLGVVIGDGVALGVELVDLGLDVAARRGASSADASSGS
jgi:hypothetical protein